MIRKICIVDIDHVISAAWSRDHMIGGEWNDYHAASVNDEPIHDIVEMLNALYAANYTIIALTARPEKWRTLTMRWLVEHNAPIDELLMRPDDAYHPAPEIKVQLAQARFPGDALRNEVAFLLEDRADVCEAFAALGITTMQVKGRQQP